MKPEMHNEKHIRILDLNPSRGAVIGLTLFFLTTALLSYLAWGHSLAAAEEPAAPSAPYASLRQYYLTISTYSATGAMTACASGYHFASLWEILDTSNLVYDDDLGVDAPDSGEGPPVTWSGWVRTGYYVDHSPTVGHANCDGWTSISGTEHYGTTARLPSSWSAGGELHVWDVNLQDCDVPGHIWCVED